MPITRGQARTAKLKAKSLLADVPEVVGIGIGKQGDEYVLKINVRMAPSTPIPEVIDGVSVTLDVIGSVKKR